MTASCGGSWLISGSGGGGQSQPVSLRGMKSRPARVSVRATCGPLSQETLCPLTSNACAVRNKPPQSRWPGKGAETNQKSAMEALASTLGGPVRNRHAAEHQLARGAHLVQP